MDAPCKIHASWLNIVTLWLTLINMRVIIHIKTTRIARMTSQIVAAAALPRPYKATLENKPTHNYTRTSSSPVAVATSARHEPQTPQSLQDHIPFYSA